MLAADADPVHAWSNTMSDTSAIYNLDHIRYLWIACEWAKRTAFDPKSNGDLDPAYNMAFRELERIEAWPRLRGLCRDRLGIACESDNKTVEALQDWLQTQGFTLEQARQMPLLEALLFVESAPERLQEPGQRNSVMGMLGHADLAEINDCPPEALRKLLERWRIANPHLEGKKGWMKLEDRGPRDPGHLFNAETVQPIIDGLKARVRRNVRRKKIPSKRPVNH
jgi:hypothetical protein